MTAFSILTPSSYLDAGKSSEKITGDFMSGSSLLGALAGAVKDLGDSLGMLSKVRGIAQRVWELEQALAKCHKVEETEAYLIDKQTSAIEFRDVTVKVPEPDETTVEDCEDESSKVLTQHLTFKIQPGQHVVLTGENGAGKSSLLMTLSGLWPPLKTTASQEGVIVLSKQALFFVPQDSYFTPGSLLEQVTYPHSETSITVQEARDLLSHVGLSHIAERYQDREHVMETWSTVLSGGERQKLSISRLFFHARRHGVKFAILDESFSAIDKESVTQLIEKAKNEGLTLFTVSHSTQIDKLHDMNLHLEKSGSWILRPVEH